MLVRTSSGMPSVATNSRVLARHPNCPATLKTRRRRASPERRERLDDLEDGFAPRRLGQQSKRERFLRVSFGLASQPVDRLGSVPVLTQA